MCGYLRFSLTGLIFVGSLSATPAFSNSYTDLLNNALRAPAAISSAQVECLPQPGSSPRAGQRWMYRLDGQRKCWFLAENTAKMRKPVRGRPANGAPSSEENETARRRRSPVVNARAELLSSAPPVGAQPTPPARELKVTDAASMFGMGTAAPAQTVSVTDLPASQTMLDHAIQSDSEEVLAASPVPIEAVIASAPPNMSVGIRPAEIDEGRASPIVTWTGLLLIALGVVSILSASRALREAVPLRH